MSYPDSHENLLDDEEYVIHEPLSFRKKLFVLVSALSVSGALVLSSALEYQQSHSILRAHVDHASSVSRIGGGAHMNVDKKKKNGKHHANRHHRGRRFYLRHRMHQKGRAGVGSYYDGGKVMATKENSQLDPKLGREQEDDDKYDRSDYNYFDELYELIAYEDKKSQDHDRRPQIGIEMK